MIKLGLMKLLCLPAGCLGIVLASNGFAQEVQFERRNKMKTDVSDELLSSLEKDFVDLAEKSKFRDKLLEAERHLEGTSNRSIWDYRNGLKLVLENRDIASVPLLLRYMVVHTNVGNTHISIPQYRETLTKLTGREFAPFYVSGPNFKTQIRESVRKVYNDWWIKQRDSITIDTNDMPKSKLGVIADYMIRNVKKNGDFNGSGGEMATAYRAYHNVMYRVRSRSGYERMEINPLDENMLNVFLDKFEKSAGKEFPYEAVWILAEFATAGHSQRIEETAQDQSQGSALRLAATLALHRAGQRYATENVLSLLESKNNLQARLIMIATLRWGDKESTLPVLLKALEDPNIEIATIAGCALEEIKPAEAIPKMRKLLESAPNQTPLLLYNTIATYKTAESRKLLRDLLEQAIEQKQDQKIYRLLSAYADAWDIPRNEYQQSRTNRNYELQARLAMSYADKAKKKQGMETVILKSLVQSLQEQVDVASKIQELRDQEYRRLLKLQGDRVSTAAESQAAFEKLNSVTAELDALSSRLMAEKAKLDSLH